MTAAGGAAARCRARHERARGGLCPRCRRDGIVDRVAAVETSLPRAQLAAAVDAVAGSNAGSRSLAAAFAADPDCLGHGTPPVAGRLVAELLARGSTVLSVPACVVCGRGGRPLTATASGGMCPRCAARRDPLACTRCGMIKPVAARTGDGQPICERCRRAERGRRACGRCGQVASIAVQALAGSRMSA